MTKDLDIAELQRFLRRFARERDWEQYHSPKNLAMAIAGEAGELLALFQWLTPEESEKVMGDAAISEAVREEVADIFQYLVRLADVLEINLAEALWTKLRQDETRFPPAHGGTR